MGLKVFKGARSSGGLGLAFELGLRCGLKCLNPASFWLVDLTFA